MRVTLQRRRSPQETVALLRRFGAALSLGILIGPGAAWADAFDSAFGGSSAGFGASNAFDSTAFGDSARDAFSMAPLRTTLSGNLALNTAQQKSAAPKPKAPARRMKILSMDVFGGWGETEADALDAVRGKFVQPEEDVLQSVISGNVEGNTRVQVGDFIPSNIIDNNALSGAQGALTIIQNAADNVVIQTQMNVNVNIN